MDSVIFFINMATSIFREVVVATKSQTELLVDIVAVSLTMIELVSTKMPAQLLQKRENSLI